MTTPDEGRPAREGCERCGRVECTSVIIAAVKRQSDAVTTWNAAVDAYCARWDSDSAFSGSRQRGEYDSDPETWRYFQPACDASAALEAAQADCAANALDWRSLYFASLAPPVARVEGTVIETQIDQDGNRAIVVGVEVDASEWMGRRVSIEVKPETQKGAG